MVVSLLDNMRGALVSWSEERSSTFWLHTVQLRAIQRQMFSLLKRCIVLILDIRFLLEIIKFVSRLSGRSWFLTKSERMSDVEPVRLCLSEHPSSCFGSKTSDQLSSAELQPEKSWCGFSAFPRNFTHWVCLCCLHISQAEGLEQSFSTSLLLEVSAFPEESSLSRELVFVFPADVVEGSQRVLVTAVGM